MSGLPSIGPIQNAVAFQRAFEVSRETLERLEAYEALLRQWQKAVNLVAPSTLDAVWHRHFGDSAQLLRFLPEKPGVICDLGSGAGFPGLVLAILLTERRGWRVFLVESDQRKSAFLRDVARTTGISVDIVSTRIESTETQRIVGKVDFVTARALAPLGQLFGLAHSFWDLETVGLFLKGRGFGREIEDARRTWVFNVALFESLTDAQARVAVVRQLMAKTEG